jgi:hypothetical protein
MKCVTATLMVIAVLLLVPAIAVGQLEVGAQYTHLTGNDGLDGLSASVGWQFNRRVTLVGQGDLLWDTSRAGVFDLAPNVGAVSLNSNLQDILGGARVRVIGFKPLKSIEKRKLLPFGELLFGVSRLSQRVKDSQGTVSIQAADRAFTWVLGGGLDYTLSGKWLARTNIDLVRTHFVDAGQTRMRLSIGLAHVF